VNPGKTGALEARRTKRPGSERPSPAPLGAVALASHRECPVLSPSRRAAHCPSADLEALEGSQNEPPPWRAALQRSRSEPPASKVGAAPNRLAPSRVDHPRSAREPPSTAVGARCGHGHREAVGSNGRFAISLSLLLLLRAPPRGSPAIKALLPWGCWRLSLSAAARRRRAASPGGDRTAAGRWRPRA